MTYFFHRVDIDVVFFQKNQDNKKIFRQEDKKCKKKKKEKKERKKMRNQGDLGLLGHKICLIPSNLKEKNKLF